jgi:hypothetical protein
VLDWRLIAAALRACTAVSPDATWIYRKDPGLLGELAQLAGAARRLYGAEATVDAMLAEWAPLLAPGSPAAFLGAGLLSRMLPTKDRNGRALNTARWMGDAVRHWTGQLARSPDWDVTWLVLLKRAASAAVKHTCGSCGRTGHCGSSSSSSSSSNGSSSSSSSNGSSTAAGMTTGSGCVPIPWGELMPHVHHALHSVLDVPLGALPSTPVRPHVAKCSGRYETLLPSPNRQWLGVAAAAGIAVSALHVDPAGGKSPVDGIATLLGSIAHLCHPSNAGEWVTRIGSVILQGCNI